MAVETLLLGQLLTDRAFVSPGVVDLVVAHGLGTVHRLVKHVQLHRLLLNELLLVAGIEAVLLLLHLGVVVGARYAELVVLRLDHVSARAILEVALLLVGLDGDVSVHAIVVFLLLSEHSALEGL